MKTILKFAMSVLVVFGLASCGSKGDGTLKPMDPSILYTTYSGVFPQYKNLSIDGCFEIQSATMRLEPDNDLPMINSRINVDANIKTVKAPSSDFKGSTDFESHVEILDGDEKVLAEFFEGNYYKLKNSTVGDITLVKLDDPNGISNSEAKKIFEKAKYIRIKNFAVGVEK